MTFNLCHTLKELKNIHATFQEETAWTLTSGFLWTSDSEPFRVWVFTLQPKIHLFNQVPTLQFNLDTEILVLKSQLFCFKRTI